MHAENRGVIRRMSSSGIIMGAARAERCRLEGIVSKQKASPYRSGRTADWIKSKNPDAPAVKREAEQEWDQWPSKKARPSSR